MVKMIFPVQMSPFEKRQMMTILDSDFHSDDAAPAHCLFLCSCSAYIYYKYLPHKTFFGAGFENKDPPRPPLVVRGSSGLTPLRRRAPGLCHQVRWSVSAPKAVEIIVRKAQYWKGISVTILAGAAWMNTLRLCRLTYPFFYFFGLFLQRPVCCFPFLLLFVSSKGSIILDFFGESPVCCFLSFFPFFENICDHRSVSVWDFFAASRPLVFPLFPFWFQDYCLR